VVVIVAEAIAVVVVVAAVVVMHCVQFLKETRLCYFDLLGFVIYLCCICNWPFGC
jgi:hypothetical protein